MATSDTHPHAPDHEPERDPGHERDAGTQGPAANGIRETVDRAAQSAHDAIDRVAAKAGPALEQVHSAASGAAQSVRDKATSIGEMEEAWLASARACVRDHPLASVLAALAVGMLISKMSR